MGPFDITIDIGAVLVKELVMKGSFRYGVRSSISSIPLLKIDWL